MEEIFISQNKLLGKIELQEQNLLGLNKIIEEQNDKLEKYSQKIELLKTEMEKMKILEKCKMDLDKEPIEQNIRSLRANLMNRPNFT